MFLSDFRVGASSGILLGAVTLPTVMVSRLIQLSRALLKNEVGVEGTYFTCADVVGIIGWKLNRNSLKVGSAWWINSCGKLGSDNARIFVSSQMHASVNLFDGSLWIDNEWSELFKCSLRVSLGPYGS